MRGAVVVTGVAALAVGLATAGCESADPRPGPPAAAPTTGPVERRIAEVPAPADFDRQIIQFADARRGYAQYLRCGSNTRGEESCTGILTGTVDGGRSWRELRHPHPVAKNLQLYVGAGGELMVLAEPGGWYASTDGGASFSHLSATTEPAPARYYALVHGRYAVECERQRRCLATEFGASAATVLARQPDLPGELRLVTQGGDGRLWAGALDGRTIGTAVSTDDGRSWRRLAVPLGPVEVSRIDLRISADGADVWLLGYPPVDGGGSGGAVPGRRLRKDVGLPLIWQLDRAGWRHRPTGLPDDRTALYSFAAAGDGLLAVASRHGFGYLTPDGFRPATVPARLGFVTVLPDGTLFGYGDDTGRVILLGTGTGWHRTWAEVLTSPG